jgi:hypothetical protein
MGLSLAALVMMGTGSAGVATGSAASSAASAAAASPKRVTVHLVCAFPWLGNQDMTAAFDWEAPDSLAVGQQSPRFPVAVQAVVGSAVPQSLGALGASAVDGSANVAITVTAPQGDIPVDMKLAVPKTTVPGSGTMQVDAAGTAPILTFATPGTARVTVSGVSLHLTPRDSGGRRTLLGTVDASCSPKCRENGFVADVAITGKAASTPPARMPSRSSSQCSTAASGGTPTAVRLTRLRAPLLVAMAVTAAGASPQPPSSSAAGCAGDDPGFQSWKPVLPENTCGRRCAAPSRAVYPTAWKSSGRQVPSNAGSVGP